MKKYRMKTWYWGNYTTMPEIKREGWNIKDLEPYIEELHGWHHSEEAKRGLKQWTL